MEIFMYSSECRHSLKRWLERFLRKSCLVLMRFPGARLSACRSATGSAVGRDRDSCRSGRDGFRWGKSLNREAIQRTHADLHDKCSDDL